MLHQIASSIYGSQVASFNHGLRSSTLQVIVIVQHRVVNCFDVKVNLLDLANLYDASCLCSLWSRAQWESW